MDKDRKFNSVMEEVREQRIIIQKLRQQNQSLKSDLAMVEREFSTENGALVQAYDAQTKELDFFMQLCH